MPFFEFVVAGPPATVNIKDKNPRRYQRWIREVRTAASRNWPADGVPTDAKNVVVSVTNYYRVIPARPNPPDVDNVLKPILDGMNGVVYVDDGQVFRVISDRFDLGQVAPPPGTTGARAAADYDEFLLIRVAWEEEER